MKRKLVHRRSGSLDTKDLEWSLLPPSDAINHSPSSNKLLLAEMKASPVVGACCPVHVCKRVHYSCVVLHYRNVSKDIGLSEILIVE